MQMKDRGMCEKMSGISISITSGQMNRMSSSWFLIYVLIISFWLNLIAEV